MYKRYKIIKDVHTLLLFSGIFKLLKRDGPSFIGCFYIIFIVDFIYFVKVFGRNCYSVAVYCEIVLF